MFIYILAHYSGKVKRELNKVSAYRKVLKIRGAPTSKTAFSSVAVPWHKSLKHVLSVRTKTKRPRRSVSIHIKGNTAQRTSDGFARHMLAYTNFPNNNSKPVGRNSICLCYPLHHTMSMLSSSALAYEISARHLYLLTFRKLVFPVISHKNLLTYASMPASFLCNLTKNLTAHLHDNNCAVLP